MVEREPGLNEALFMGLVINLQSTAMIALGKLISPLTQKIERNLDQARFTIDMLGMLEDKTDGNRTDDETRTLKTALTELRMNYLDEVEKDRQEQEKDRPQAAKSGEKVVGEGAEGQSAAKTTEEDRQQKAKKATGETNDKKS